jgi:hypothetical protein
LVIRIRIFDLFFEHLWFAVKQHPDLSSVECSSSSLQLFELCHWASDLSKSCSCISVIPHANYFQPGSHASISYHSVILLLNFQFIYKQGQLVLGICILVRLKTPRCCTTAMKLRMHTFVLDEMFSQLGSTLVF